MVRSVGSTGWEPRGQPSRVHSTYRWVVEDGSYVEAVDLRHELNDFLLVLVGLLAAVAASATQPAAGPPTTDASVCESTTANASRRSATGSVNGSAAAAS